jgi:hypothetical protein
MTCHNGRSLCVSARCDGSYGIAEHTHHDAITLGSALASGDVLGVHRVNVEMKLVPDAVADYTPIRFNIPWRPMCRALAGQKLYAASYPPPSTAIHRVNILMFLMA